MHSILESTGNLHLLWLYGSIRCNMSWLENGKEDNTDLKEKYERKGMIYIIIGLVVIAKIAAIIGGFLWVMYMIGLLVLCYIVNH